VFGFDAVLCWVSGSFSQKAAKEAKDVTGQHVGYSRWALSAIVNWENEQYFA